MDTDMLFILTSTTGELSGVPTLMTLNDFEIQKAGFWSFVYDVRPRRMFYHRLSRNFSAVAFLLSRVT